MSATANPRFCAVFMGTLIKGLGANHVFWGTDSVWYGSPQWQIEALRRLEIPEDMRKKHGFAALGLANSQVKASIFGFNAARHYNVELHAGLMPWETDGMGRQRAATPPTVTSPAAHRGRQPRYAGARACATARRAGPVHSQNIIRLRTMSLGHCRIAYSSWRDGSFDGFLQCGRGSARRALAEAGCELPEIGTITGHPLDDVEAILDAHYLGWATKLAVSAVVKLERAAPGDGNRWRTKIGKQSNRSRCRRAGISS
jgi:hypothetical protein